MTLKLFKFPQPTCSQKVRLTLWERQIPLVDRPVDSTKREHLSDWYLKLNPNGVVPTLEHKAFYRGTCLTEIYDGASYGADENQAPIVHDNESGEAN